MQVRIALGCLAEGESVPVAEIGFDQTFVLDDGKTEHAGRCLCRLTGSTEG
ncbi:Uncharacterised protein [Mycobacteroides abscessus subsp. abscessus]|nr:Uncharacterised protein [Mycobacteroides abscessus subsp. abscessus]